MSQQPPTFSLISEPWIPCMDAHGLVHDRSLHQIFSDLSGVTRLAAEQPVVNFALLRILLAIFWRSQTTSAESPWDTNLEEWWEAALSGDYNEQIATAATTYLHEHHDRFDLLHPSMPFMQVSDLHTAKDTQVPSSRLMLDTFTGQFSMRSGAGLANLSFAESARLLITLQAWDYSGIKSGAVGDDRVKGGRGYPIGTGWAGETGGIALLGNNLMETLLLNTPPLAVFDPEVANDDKPVWEREPDTAQARSTDMPMGPCDVLTWQSRRVRLHREDDTIVGVLVSNGDKIQTKNQEADPMTGYRYSPNQSKKGIHVFMPQRHSIQDTLWRGVNGLFTHHVEQPTKKNQPANKVAKTIEWMHTAVNQQLLTKSQLVQVELVGMEYGTQSASYVSQIHDVLAIQLSVLGGANTYLEHAIVNAAEVAQEVAISLGRLQGNFDQAAGGEYAFRPDIKGQALADLEAPYKRWLASLSEDSEAVQVRNDWLQHVQGFALYRAQELLSAVNPAAILGRWTNAEDKSRLMSAGVAMAQFRARIKTLTERQTVDNRTEIEV